MEYRSIEGKLGQVILAWRSAYVLSLVFSECLEGRFMKYFVTK